MSLEETSPVLAAFARNKSNSFNFQVRCHGNNQGFAGTLIFSRLLLYCWHNWIVCKELRNCGVWQCRLCLVSVHSCILQLLRFVCDENSSELPKHTFDLSSLPSMTRRKTSRIILGITPTSSVPSAPASRLFLSPCLPHRAL